MKQLKYLVTGTGRSGTVFMSRLLTSVGILCGHESIFDFKGIERAKERLYGYEKIKLSGCSTNKYDPLNNTHSTIDWHPDIKSIVADASYMAAPYLNDQILKSTVVIHIVRNPVKVINSFCNSLDYFNDANRVEQDKLYENFIYGFLPELRDVVHQYDRAALYYILWNQMIEASKPDLWARIEDNPRDLLDKLEVPADVDYFNETNINTFEKRKPDVFDCSKIKSRNIRFRLFALAEKYGYQIRPTILI